MKKITNKFL